MNYQSQNPPWSGGQGLAATPIRTEPITPVTQGKLFSAIDVLEKAMLETHNRINNLRDRLTSVTESTNQPNQTNKLEPKDAQNNLLGTMARLTALSEECIALLNAIERSLIL